MVNKLLATSSDVRKFLADRQPSALAPAGRFVQLAPDGQGGQFSHPESSVFSVNESEMSADFLISTARRDRHGDVVVPRGCLRTLPDYQRNPRIFFAHKSYDKPIASARNPKTGEFTLWVEEDKITSRAFFHGKTQESEDVYELVISKDLQAASIGFQPLVARLIEPEDLVSSGYGTDEKISFDDGGLIFDEWSLFEWSVVAVPANPDALRGWLSSRRGQKASRMVKSLLNKALPRQTRVSVSVPQMSFSVTSAATFGPHPPEAEKWNLGLGKAFDISKKKLPPATVFYNYAAQHLECDLKQVYMTGVAVPSAKIGGFLSGWKDSTAPYPVLDVRNIESDGRECPPVHEVIQLNSTKSGDFLVEGTVFHGGTVKFLARFYPTYYGLNLTLFSKQSDKAVIQKAIDRAWELAATSYNFLKGEAFALSGKFLDRTSESWDDVFLEEGNTKVLKKTADLLNKKQLQFANRGAIFLGPPGTGKTLSGRIIRNQAKATFIWISARDFYYSGSFGGIAYGFELARELAPAVLFFEDIDHWLTDTSIDLIKTEMDGMSRSAGVWTILTTNFPQNLPEALIDRPGRFHDVLQFSLPDKVARKAMLARWLPDLKGVGLETALKGTEGYSGAHVYELAHFVRTLREQDDVPLEEAVTTALDKIARQRELIGALQRPRYKSFGPVATYQKARTKSLISVQELRNFSGSDSAEQNTDVQAFVFDKDLFPDEKSVADWLEANSYEATGIHPGQEADEPCVALMFPATDCEQGTAVREEVEPGVQAVVCKLKPNKEPEQDDTYMNEKPETETPLVASLQVEERDASPPSPPGEEDRPEDKPVEGPPQKPYGAEMLAAHHEKMVQCMEHIQAGMGPLDHPQVKAHMGKMYEGLDKLHKASCSFACKTYPEHFEKAEGDDGMDDGASKALLVGMAAKDLALLADAVSLLREVEEQSQTKTSQKTACKLLATSLTEIKDRYHKPVDATVEAEKVFDGRMKQYEAAVSKLVGSVNKFKDIFYQLTGKEV